jgi:enterochelin esterase-like enzyme
MPNGYPARGPGSNPEGIEETGKELLTDIIPFIEQRYRVIADANHRALAGLSMGAGQAFITGLRHLDKFAWVGAFSSGVVSDADFRIETAVPGFIENPAAVNSRLRLLFISCGTEDPRYPGSLDLVDILKQANIQHQWYSTAGAHEWKVWRHSLAAMLPKLFQPVSRTR